MTTSIAARSLLTAFVRPSKGPSEPSLQSVYDHHPMRWHVVGAKPLVTSRTSCFPESFAQWQRYPKTVRRTITAANSPLPTRHHAFPEHFFCFQQPNLQGSTLPASAEDRSPALTTQPKTRITVSDHHKGQGATVIDSRLTSV